MRELALCKARTDLTSNGVNHASLACPRSVAVDQQFCALVFGIIEKLINQNYVDLARFENFDFIEVDPSEPDAANCLPIAGSIIFPIAFPKTRARLEERGHNVVTVDVSELAKAEGAVTCCSLIVDQTNPN